MFLMSHVMKSYRVSYKISQEGATTKLSFEQENTSPA